MAETVVVIMVLLGVGFVGTRLAQWARLPHSVFLVLLGVVTGVWIRHASPAHVAELSERFPDIILYVLLPPLVFESAYNLRLSDLRRDWFPVNLLAILGLIVSAFVVGFGLHWALSLPLAHALVFGALISATDPVAVVALFKEIGAPRRLNILVEAESLLNDGTAIVLFRVLLALAAAPVFGPATIVSGVTSFVVVAFGGILVGLGVAWVASILLRITATSAAAQLGLTVAAAFLSFILADHTFHVSGVIATMTLGLYLGTLARLKLNKEALAGMHHLWEFVALSCNTLVFLAVGATLDLSVVAGSLSVLPITIAVTYIARAISVVGLVPFGNLLKLGKPIGLKYQAILIWGGLRGGLAVALALMLPDDFQHKQLFIAMAMAVVFSTLFFNALTVAPLMRILGLTELSPTEQGFFARTMAELKQSVFLPVKQATRSGSLSGALVEREEDWLSRDYEGTAAAPAGQDTQVEFDLRSLLHREKRHYDEALEDGILSKRAYVRLVDDVTDRLNIVSESGVEASLAGSIDPRTKSVALQILEVLDLFENIRVELLTETLEVLLQRIFGLVEAAESASTDAVRKSAERWIHEAKGILEAFYQAHPMEGTAAQSFFIHNAVAAHSERALSEFLDLELISSEVYAKAMERVHHAHRLAIGRARTLMRPEPASLLEQVPIFSTVPMRAIARLVENSQTRSLHPLEVVVREGDQGDSFYLVVSGILEVRSDALSRQGIQPRLFSGDFFGELSLLFGRPRSATVTAITNASLLEISKSELEALLAEFPGLKAEILQVAERRAQRALPVPPASPGPEPAVPRRLALESGGEMEISYGTSKRVIRLAISGRTLRVHVEDGADLTVALP